MLKANKDRRENFDLCRRKRKRDRVDRKAAIGQGKDEKRDRGSCR